MEKTEIEELRKELQLALDELDRDGGIVVKHEDLRSFFDEIAKEVQVEMMRESRPTSPKRRLVDHQHQHGADDR